MIILAETMLYSVIFCSSCELYHVRREPSLQVILYIEISLLS